MPPLAQSRGMLKACTDPKCPSTTIVVIRARYYPERRITRRIHRCKSCGRMISTREEITNPNAASSYLPAHA
jgi:transcriptional regulator NrdR family protein